METDQIKQYLLDFQKRDFSDVMAREIKLSDSKKIQSILGARRVGKTYLLFSKILQLQSMRIKREQMIYLNFENPVLSDVSYKQIRDVIQIHLSLFPEQSSKHLYIFIDEPQAIEKWELAIRSLHDEFDCSIFLTGSSSKLLSKEIATSLRGRSITTTLLPLSFGEFLKFKGFTEDLSRLDSASKARMENLLDEYLQYGAYPEVVLEPNKDIKLRILKDYYDMTIFKDLVDRYSIKNTKLIKWLINYLTSTSTKSISLNKIYNTLKSEGHKLGKDTLYEYLSMLEDCFFVFTLHRFDPSVKNEGSTLPKVYLDDVGFMSLFSETDLGKRLENAVFLRLMRKKLDDPLTDLHYFKSIDGKEVDFLITRGRKPVLAVQACQSLADMATKEREMDSLLVCMGKLGLNEGVIVTRHEEAIRKVDGKKIRIVPLWKWLTE